MDHAMPGARSFVEQCYTKGMYIVYLTGRDHGMREGTEASLHRFAFPYEKERTHLITKPEFQWEDSQYKERALQEIATLGEPTLFIDNEPANVNVFKRHHANSMVVFIETDHSFLKDEPDPSIPWIRSWYRTEWKHSIPMKASIYR